MTESGNTTPSSNTGELIQTLAQFGAPPLSQIVFYYCDIFVVPTPFVWNVSPVILSFTTLFGAALSKLVPRNFAKKKWLWLLSMVFAAFILTYAVYNQIVIRSAPLPNQTLAFDSIAAVLLLVIHLSYGFCISRIVTLLFQK